MSKEVFRFKNFELPIRKNISEIGKDFIPDNFCYFLENPYIEEIIDSILNNENILLVGESGTGKSSLVLYLASVCRVPIVQIQGSGEMSEVDIIGGFQNTCNGMVWVDGLLPIALKNNFWILIDEINMVLPEILARLHSVLDNRRHLDLREINQVIKVPKDTVIFATMNPYDVGTKPLSSSLWSRFHIVVPFDYLNADKEIELLVQKTHCSKDDAELIVETANICREAYKKGEMNKIIDTRMTLAWAKKSESFKNLKTKGYENVARAAMTTVLSKLVLDDQDKVKSILSAKGVMIL